MGKWEEVVEQVGLDEIVELVATTHPRGHREAALGEMTEEIRLGNEAGHADHFEAGQSLEPVTGLFEHRDAMGSTPSRRSPAWNSGAACSASIPDCRSNSVRQMACSSGV